MQTTPRTECRLSWRPLKPTTYHQSLPAYSWNGHLLIGFESKVEEAIALNHLSLGEALINFYPEFSFVEVTRIVSEMSIDSDATRSLFEKYGFRFNDQAQKVALMCSKLPLGFLEWANEKKMGPRDLAVLLPLNDSNDVQFAYEVIHKERASNNQGRQILKLVSELFLLEHPSDQISKTEGETLPAWIERLHNLRFPVTTSEDNRLKSLVQNTTSPPHVEAQWVRKGDLTGLQVGFFSVSSKELETRLSALSRYQVKLDENLGETWTK